MTVSYELIENWGDANEVVVVSSPNKSDCDTASSDNPSAVVVEVRDHGAFVERINT